MTRSQYCSRSRSITLTVLSAWILAACGGGTSQSPDMATVGSTTATATDATTASATDTMSAAERYKRVSTTSSTAGTTTITSATPATTTVTTTTAAVTPVTLKWTTASGATVSGSKTLQLAGTGFENVEIFNGTTRVATATVSSDSTTASASIDTTSFPNGVLALTAHAWNSAAGTAFTSDADAGPLSLTIANAVANATAATVTTTTATATTTSASTAVVPRATDLNITAFGAVCDGKTNNSTAITNAIATAKSKGVGVVIPVGVCAYGAVINLDSVRLIGYGDSSVLYALDTNNESIFMRGTAPEVRSVKLSGVKATTRVAPWEATRITVFGATKFVIDHVTLDGAAAAGIQTAQSANNGTITNNTISNTLSDSIHLADKASYITIENNRISNAGDDGIAIVSSIDEGGLVDHITARNNVVTNNLWGRNMSVVGGSNVLYENNYMEGNSAQYACMYIAQEDSWATYGSSNVVVQLNTMKNCGGTSTGHGAVTVFSAGSYANTNLAFTRNDITQNGQPGIVVQALMNTAVTVDSNRITGASPALNVASAGAVVTAYTSGAVGYVAP